LGFTKLSLTGLRRRWCGLAGRWERELEEGEALCLSRGGGAGGVARG
jgi:hypothetical protein